MKDGIFSLLNLLTKNGNVPFSFIHIIDFESCIHMFPFFVKQPIHLNIWIVFHYVSCHNLFNDSTFEWHINKCFQDYSLTNSAATNIPAYTHIQEGYTTTSATARPKEILNVDKYCQITVQKQYQFTLSLKVSTHFFTLWPILHIYNFKCSF